METLFRFLVHHNIEPRNCDSVCHPYALRILDCCTAMSSPTFEGSLGILFRYSGKIMTSEGYAVQAFLLVNSQGFNTGNCGGNLH